MGQLVLSYLRCAFLLLVASTSFAQTQLVKDINTTPLTEPATTELCPCGNRLFFVASTESGSELWRSNGAANGTVMIKDILKGSGSGALRSKILCNGSGKVFFWADDGIHGLELWISDGTEANTKMIKDVTEGRNTGVTTLGFLNGNAYFFADADGDGVWELWKTSGTEANTTLVTTIDLPSAPSAFTVITTSTHLLFNFNNSVTGNFELWSTDGTAANTGRVMESTYISGSTTAGNKAYFALSGENPTLWVSDGTQIGTYLFKELESGFINSLHPFGEKFLFSYFGETWISDGTDPGTTMLTTGGLDAGAVINDEFYGFGYDYFVGSLRLFTTDGTNVTTTELGGTLSDISIFGNIPVINENLVMPFYHEEIGQELGMVSKVELEPELSVQLVKEIKSGPEGSNPKTWAVLNGKVYFMADNGSNGFELWSTDGSSAGTYFVKDILKGNADGFKANKSNLFEANGKLHLLASSTLPSLGAENLYATQGTGATTSFLFNFESEVIFRGSIGDKVILQSMGDIYLFDPQSEDITFVKQMIDPALGYSYGYESYPSINGKIAFALRTYGGPTAEGNELWVSDGTEEGTTLLKDINPGTRDGVVETGIVLNNKLLFSGDDGVDGVELWITDLTTDGTQLVADINPGDANSNPRQLAPLANGKAIFLAEDATGGRELWITDGTSAGTMMVTDLTSGPTSSFIDNITSFGNFTLFTRFTSDAGWVLWKTDGTAAGTTLVKDLDSGNKRIHAAANFKHVGSKTYFSFNSSQSGEEVWVTDGTAGGTYVLDITPGIGSSNPSMFTDVKGLAYFKANNQLWRTTGTIEETLKVDNREPIEIRAIGDQIYFVAQATNTGKELYVTSFVKLAQNISIADIPTKVVGDAPFDIEASSTAGLPVLLSGTDEVQIIDGSATIVKAGTVLITATQEGNDIYEAAQATYSFCINPPRPAISTLTDIGSITLSSSSDDGNQWYLDDSQLTGAIEKTLQPEEAGTYVVEATIDGCTSQKSEGITVNITAVDPSEELVRCYPNPVQDELKIQATAGEVELSLIDANGRMVGSYRMSDGEEVIHSFRRDPPGFYVLKINHNSKTYFRKLIRQ
jgi:ELWxxDGT repeat protein